MRSRADASSDAEALGRGDRLPDVRVAPPGPVARRLNAALAHVEAPLLAGDGSLPPLEAARGGNVLDVDGNRYIDWTSGFGVAFSGHRPPEVVRAFAGQAERLLHGLSDAASHRLRLTLARQLVALAPLPGAVEERRVYWAISGSDAVDIALKAACLFTGRAGVLAFDPAYHGLGLGAVGTASRPAFRDPLERLLDVDRVSRLTYGCPVAQLRGVFERTRPGAVIVEPVVGREGVKVPPSGWLVELANLARAYGAVLIADEVLTGGGRTGRWFACEHEGFHPDLICCGKVISGGAPLAAVLGHRDLLDVFAGHGEALHTSTFLAHPPACAAAIANLKRIRRLGLLERAGELGLRVEEWGAMLGPNSTLQGRGALYGLWLETPDHAAQFAWDARRQGFFVLASGPVVQLMPPAVLTSAQIEASLAAFGSLLG